MLAFKIKLKGNSSEISVVQREDIARFHFATWIVRPEKEYYLRHSKEHLHILFKIKASVLDWADCLKSSFHATKATKPELNKGFCWPVQRQLIYTFQKQSLNISSYCKHEFHIFRETKAILKGWTFKMKLMYFIV